MTREEHLLTIIAEECVEIAKNATKALRFGLDDCEPGQRKTNAARILEEAADLAAMFEMLRHANGVFAEEYERAKVMQATWIENKIYKVEKFLEYSKERERLS